MAKLFLLISFISLNFLSCENNSKVFNQQILNELGYEALSYAIKDKCFNYQAFSYDTLNHYISVSQDLKNLLNESDTLRNFNLKVFVSKSNMIDFKKINFLADTIQNKKVIFSNWEDIIKGIDFQFILSNKIDGSNKIKSLTTYILSKPYVLTSGDKNVVLFKIGRYFEYVFDKTYLLITTDKSFKVLNIECIEEVKPVIPYPNRDTITKYIHLDSIHHD
ncbi:MAG: hypothetical protein U0T36_08960 [Saprospiraceae bacterium]